MLQSVAKTPPTRSRAAINPSPSDSLTAPECVGLAFGAGCVGAIVGAIVVPKPDVVVPLPATVVALVGIGYTPVLAAVTVGMVAEGLK